MTVEATMETLDARLELKAAGDKGGFEGYAAVFGNKDLGDDIILPGAFESVKTTGDGKLRIALYHDLQRLMALADYSQDDHGLHVKGQVNMKVSYARDAFELMKDGSLDGMSVGFNIMPGGATWEKSDGDDDYPVRIISKAELWEASVVPFGMNPEAKIESVKRAFGMPDWRELESALREGDFSRKNAKYAVSVLRKILQSYAADGQSAQSDSELLNSEKLGQLKELVGNFRI
jgi:HK97 family phage prohead protease